MIKTLRITGVAVVILAGVLLASILVPTSLRRFVAFGARSDRQISKILAEPNAVARFRQQHGTDDRGEQDTTPALVKQAEILAKIINPPPSAGPKPSTTKTAGTSGSPKPPQTSAKFGLVGTAYSPSSPTVSFAYIRLADNSYQWVQQGEEIAHYVIKEVKAGSIVCWDGSRNVEMTVEPPPETADMLETGEAAAAPAVSAPVVAGTPGRAAARPVAANPGIPANPAAASAPDPSLQLTPEEEETLGSLVDRIKEQEGDPTAREAAIKKIVEGYRATRAPPEETEKLENLGEEQSGKRDAAKEAQRRESLRRLTAPRSTKK